MSTSRKSASPDDAAEFRPPVVAMVSLGCAKNQVDSERVLGMLAERGFAIASDPGDADVVLVNTCAFISSAREETEETLRRLCRPKRRAAVVALGCYSERLPGRKRSSIFRHSSLPGVDAFVALDSYDALPDICGQLAGLPPAAGEECGCFGAAPRLHWGSPASAYLKIAEGCSNRCNYCAIPSIRGPLESVPMEELIAEAEGLAGLGVKELCVIAQDTANYGVDMGGKPRLAELLTRLASVDGLRWLRLMYVHPAHLGEDVLDVMASEKKICRYLDLPAQHASDRMLAAMGRRHDGAHLRGLVERIRDRLPGVALRTSIIVGHPGETEADFAELVQLVKDYRFEHLGVFTYSKEKGTPSAGQKAKVGEDVARRRRAKLMRVQQRIAFEALDSRVGRVETAMLELPTDRPGVWSARTEREAPEVDGEVFVDVGGFAAKPGKMMRARIESRTGYDLTARRAGR